MVKPKFTFSLMKIKSVFWHSPKNVLFCQCDYARWQIHSCCDTPDNAFGIQGLQDRYSITSYQSE